MAKKKSFLRQFWQEKKMVGAMAPSSRFLAKKMLKGIDFQKARVIVELGPGTGVFTDKIVELMHPEAVLLVFELNDNFIAQLQARYSDPRVHLIHDSAEKIQEYLDKNGLTHADVVVSSLPLANFPKELRNSILNAADHALVENGHYVQFQYSLQSKKQIQKVFRKTEIRFTPLNFPPAFVYACRK
jgi:phosphatidylethanolamine/phosphatidyl-N-methylethanolamine N-methyltransferase